MSSPAARSDSSSLSPPPSTLSTPSPEPFFEETPPPKPVARRKPKSKDIAKTKSPKSKGKELTKITLKLKQHPPTDKPEKEKVKKPLPKPREPKIEPIPRSVVNNFEVPLVCLFRSKFRALFSGTSELGPQDVEEGVNVEGDIEGKLEEFVCRICTLIGNRRKNVEHENLSKILQETVDSCVEKIRFRKDGINTSPMLNTTFASMDWDARVLNRSKRFNDAVRQIIDDGYKVPQNSRVEREELDINTGLGVLPLATVKNDNYYLIEGKDTRFRIYHCTNPYNKIINISSVAEDKPSLLAFAEKLSTGSKQEKELGTTIRETIIAKIEAAEQRRVKAEQAALRLAMWKASAPVYNTRTRGKRVDYTELEKDSGSEDEEDSRGGRRSERNRDRETVEYTASGRMVKRPRMGNGTETRESRFKNEDDEESEEEMEWSVYSDKGQETDGVDDEEEGEEEEYDLGRRTLVVKFRVSKERLKAVTTMGDCIPANGLPRTSQESIEPRPAQHSAQHSSKSHQPRYSQFQYYSPPKVYTPTIPRHSPSQIAAPLPYTGGASPPLVSRPVNLSPQPIPQPFTQSPSQAYPQPSPYRPYQASPRAPQELASPQSPRQSPYAVAQFQPQASPPRAQSMMQTSPRPYAHVKGGSRTSPTLSAQTASGSLGPAWSPPRPFGTSSHGLGVSVYGKPPAPTAPTASPYGPISGSPHQSDVSPPAPTWSTASFQSNSLANGNPQSRPEQPQPNHKLPPLVTDIINGEKQKIESMNGSGDGRGVAHGESH